MDMESWTAEEVRQTQILTAAMQNTLIETAKTFQTIPMAGAAVATLAILAGRLLAQIPAGKPRSRARSDFDTLVKRTIANVPTKEQGRMQAINIDRGNC